MGPKMSTQSDESADKPSPNPDQAAFDSTTNLLKLLTSLGTGTLVFSIGLLAPNGFLFAGWIKFVLIVTWICLFLGVAAGIWAQSLLPLQLKSGNLDINTPDLRGAAMALESFFVLGILGIAIALIATILTAPSAVKARLATPISALLAANRTMFPEKLVKIGKIELLKGVDEGRNADSSWHVQLYVKKDGQRRRTVVARDFYIDPVTGHIIVEP